MSARRQDLPAPVVSVTRRVFAGLSRARGGRAFHLEGVVARGTFRHEGGEPTGAAVLDRAGERPVLVRLSRSFNPPQPLPDTLGLAVRWVHAYGPGRHQDQPLASALGAAVGARHGLAVGWDFFGAFYSSLLPLRIGGRLLLLGARLQDHDGTACRSVAALRGRLTVPGQVSISIAVASTAGPWRRVGTISIDGIAEDLPDLRFDPSQAGHGMELWGPIHKLRVPAYDASRTGVI